MRRRVTFRGFPSLRRWSIEKAAAVAVETATMLTAIAKATKMGRSHVSPRRAGRAGTKASSARRPAPRSVGTVHDASR